MNFDHIDDSKHDLIERPLPRVVVHLVGAYLVAARAAAIDGPRAPLDFNLLRVALVGQQERAYGGPCSPSSNMR